MVIDAWADELSGETAVLAGDLNCSAQGPSALPHLANIDRLEGLGVVSAYHVHNRIAHGAEPEMTLRWIGPGRVARSYHCDFVFLSQAARGALRHSEVGSLRDWVETGLSDHVPLMVGLERDALT